MEEALDDVEHSYDVFTPRTIEDNTEYLGKLLHMYRQGLEPEDMKNEEEALEHFSIESVASDLEKLEKAMAEGLPGHVLIDLEKEAGKYCRESYY